MVLYFGGELAERFKAPSWKGGVVKATMGSNPIFSARYNMYQKQAIINMICRCGEMADASHSKCDGKPCRFESDHRYHEKL